MVVNLDLKDKNKILREKGDEGTIIPRKLQKALLGALKDESVWTPCKSDMVSEAFLRMFVEMVGHCQEFMIEGNNREYRFQVIMLMMVT